MEPLRGPRLGLLRGDALLGILQLFSLALLLLGLLSLLLVGGGSFLVLLPLNLGSLARGFLLRLFALLGGIAVSLFLLELSLSLDSLAIFFRHALGSFTLPRPLTLALPHLARVDPLQIV